MNRFIFFLMLIFVSIEMWAITGAEILSKLDKQMEIKTDITAKTKITQQKGDSVKIIECIYYRRDSDDSFLIIMTSPEVEKGNGYLKVGDNFWMYKRNTRTFQHINRDESIAGTDAKSGDLEKRKMSELYKVSVEGGKEKVSEEMLGKIPVYKVEVVAKVEDVTYPKQILWIHRDNFLVLKVQSFSLSGTLMQSAYYLKYTEIDKRFVPLQQIFIDEFEKGNKTIVELSGISFEKIPDYVFTKAYLENLSK
jgi:outer membrane lipoprotein-sorting protein